MNTYRTATERNESPTSVQVFVRAAIVSFATLTTILFSIDFVPESPIRNATVAVDNASSTPEPYTTRAEDTVPEITVPVRIRIASIGVDSSIVSPQSTDIAVLDRALLSGAVHYPGTARAGEVGNMLLFGHSSYLPVVHNKSFQTFNELSKLVAGDTIEVMSDTHRYLYVVDTKVLTRAEDAVVPLDVDRPTLTLATCNTFGAKQERWVVTAHVRSKTPLASLESVSDSKDAQLP